MGRSTVQQLITRGQNQNEYNKTGINSNAQWVDYFNDALQDLAPDLDIRTSYVIPFDGVIKDYALPADFVELVEITDSSFFPIPKRRYETPFPYNGGFGYYVTFSGSQYTINLDYFTSAQPINIVYVRLPVLIEITPLTVRPEIPTVGENALIYYAISKSLRNNNLPGQAQEVEGKYERERKKIRDNVQRAVLGGAW